MMLADLREYVCWMQGTHEGLTHRSIAAQAGLHKSAVTRLLAGADVTYDVGTRVLRALRQVHLGQLVSPDATLGDIMTSPITWASPGMTLKRAYEVMISRQFSILPVGNKDGCRGYLLLSAITELQTQYGAACKIRDVSTESLQGAPVALDADAAIGEAAALLHYHDLLLVSKWGQIRGVVAEDNLARVQRIRRDLNSS